MLKFIIGFLALLISLALVSRVAYDIFSLKSKGVESQFQAAWSLDMEQLQNSQKLPNGWSEISEIKYHLLTPSTKKWANKILAPVKLNKNGDYLLEITLTDWKDDDRTGIVVQYHLINKLTGDLTSEFGRTFVF